MIASAYRSGEIVLGQRCPRGALQIVDAPGRALRPIVEVIARHAPDGKTLLVPGVPEALDQTAAFKAMKHFRLEVQKRLAAVRAKATGLAIGGDA